MEVSKKLSDVYSKLKRLSNSIFSIHVSSILAVVFSSSSMEIYVYGLSEVTYSTATFQKKNMIH